MCSGQSPWHASVATDLERVIPDAELRAAAAQRASTPVSVLIEVAGDTDRVVVEAGRPQRVEPAGGGSAAAALRTLLRDHLGGEPTWLPSAKAFAVDCAAAELAELAVRPEVRRITPNRRHITPNRGHPLP